MSQAIDHADTVQEVDALVDPTKRTVDVVVPAYNEIAGINKLVRSLRAVFDSEPEHQWRAIVVENGSPDSTWELLAAAAKLDPRICVVRLARNLRFAGNGMIVLLLLLIFGMIASMGVSASYIALICEEVKHRPNFVVRETVGLASVEKYEGLQRVAN